MHVGELPLQAPRDQPVNVPPLFGVAVRVTTVPLVKVSPHDCPSSEVQSIPVGLLVMVPPPDTATDSCAGSFQLAGGV